jgi:hypothetical protein
MVVHRSIIRSGRLALAVTGTGLPPASLGGWCVVEARATAPGAFSLTGTPDSSIMGAVPIGAILALFGWSRK